jgi:hypothetical protein
LIARAIAWNRSVWHIRCLPNRAEVEHTLAKQLVEELETIQPDDALYGAKFTVLGEYVARHIEEEQKEMFPKVKKGQDGSRFLREQMSARKRELLAVAEGEQQRKGRRSKKNGGMTARVLRVLCIIYRGETYDDNDINGHRRCADVFL